MSIYVLPEPEKGTLMINIQSMSGDQETCLFGLSGSGEGWSANGTELTLQPTAAGGAYYVLSLALTEGYSFAGYAAEIWGPNSLWGVVLTADDPSLRIYDNIPANSSQYLNVSAFINVNDNKTMPFSFLINLLPPQ